MLIGLARPGTLPGEKLGCRAVVVDWTDCNTLPTQSLGGLVAPERIVQD